MRGTLNCFILLEPICVKCSISYRNQSLDFRYIWSSSFVPSSKIKKELMENIFLHCFEFETKVFKNVPRKICGRQSLKIRSVTSHFLTFAYHEFYVALLEYFVSFNPYLAYVPILYLLKTPENLWFFSCFQGVWNGRMARNGLRDLHNFFRRLTI